MIDFLEIRDTTRKLVGVIDNAKSIIWDAEYYGAGRFEVYAPNTPNNKALLLDGYYITRRNDAQIAIIEGIEYDNSVQDGQMIIATGRFAKSVLDRRIIYNLSGNANAPTRVSGNVAAAAQTLVQKHAGAAASAARNLGIVQGSNGGITQTITTAAGAPTSRQTSYGGLLEFTDGLLQEYGCGAYIGLNASLQLEYNCFQGKDRSVGNTEGNTPLIFSQDFDNLVSTQYTKNTATEKNTALVGGEGEGMQRFCVEISDSSLTPWQRRETFIDASGQSRQYTDSGGNEQTYTSAEYAEMLTAQGRAELSEMIPEETFVGELNLNYSPYKYGQNADFWLGDKITIQDNALGLYMTVRVTKATEVQDDGGYNLTVEYSNE